MSNTSVGFIGLGLMGNPIARRLARQGFAVTGCDIHGPTLEAFDEEGTARAADPIEAARGKDFVGICVRTDDQLRNLAGDGRIFEAQGDGGIFIITSTVAPGLAQELEEIARPYGVSVIDVGVSGGHHYALEGKLSLFVGGDDETIARAREWLEAIGTISHLGPVGRGLQGKLLNNLACIANYGLAASILDIGVALDFDREQLREALQRGSAQSFALQVVPGMVGWRENSTAEGVADLRDLLAKDVYLSRDLVAAEDPAMSALQNACHVLLRRMDQAASELAGK
ncbi:NAD(P)-dependent oxidoreductase [Altererythrobacter aquaemixtae]|uniref:NAD(P)-dependent oxidoreductase n=2 Tax=Pontixanthobacter aquaemixtae TaxID=1958940 RepID=A0A844ZWP3_9SPHN|nr:NAD(P)-dependent oxidoreductase [Pontixanthobacter aquaemixtae]